MAAILPEYRTTNALRMCAVFMVLCLTPFATKDAKAQTCGVTAPTTSGLISYWTLDETGGTYTDLGSLGNDAANYNSPTSESGVIGNAVRTYYATDSFVMAPTTATYQGLTAMTFSMWIKPEAGTFNDFNGYLQIEDVASFRAN